MALNQQVVSIRGPNVWDSPIQAKSCFVTEIQTKCQLNRKVASLNHTLIQKMAVAACFQCRREEPCFGSLYKLPTPSSSRRRTLKTSCQSSTTNLSAVASRNHTMTQAATTAACIGCQIDGSRRERCLKTSFIFRSTRITDSCTESILGASVETPNPTFSSRKLPQNWLRSTRIYDFCTESSFGTSFETPNPRFSSRKVAQN